MFNRSPAPLHLPVIAWPVPNEFPSLGPGHVHVWCAWLDAPGADGPAAMAVLSADDRSRAAAFHFAADRRRYIAAHAAVRHLLGGYLAVAPADLLIGRGAYGKPAVAGGELQFNLSHSGPLALIAVARDQALGVDVEQRWDLPDVALLEERLFPPAARRHQQRLARDPRLRSFYRRWTELEATGKCRGTGLDFEKNPPGAEQLIAADPAEGFTGCLACEKPPALIAFFRYLQGMPATLPETTASTAPILPGLPHRLEGIAPLSSS